MHTFHCCGLLSCGGESLKNMYCGRIFGYINWTKNTNSYFLFNHLTKQNTSGVLKKIWPSFRLRLFVIRALLYFDVTYWTSCTVTVPIFPNTSKTLYRQHLLSLQKSVLNVVINFLPYFMPLCSFFHCLSKKFFTLLTHCQIQFTLTAIIILTLVHVGIYIYNRFFWMH